MLATRTQARPSAMGDSYRQAYTDRTAMQAELDTLLAAPARDNPGQRTSRHVLQGP